MKNLQRKLSIDAKKLPGGPIKSWAISVNQDPPHTKWPFIQVGRLYAAVKNSQLG